MKILLAKRRALGDTVLLSSSVELLAKAMPEAEIYVLVPAAFAPVLANNPYVKEVWTFEEGWLKLLPRIRGEHFDYFLQLHASPRTRWLAWASGAKNARLHFQNKKTEKAYGKHPNALEWDGFFFRGLWKDKIELPAPVPRIFLREEEKAQGREFWRSRGVDPAQVVFLGLGASRQTKRWLPRHFGRLAELLKDRLEIFPAVVVGPGEHEARFAGLVLDELRVKGFRAAAGEQKPGFFHLTGLSVRELARALSAVRAYVGNDSGPKHMAVALEVPTFTIFGPEDPVEWHPYDREQHPIFFLEGLSCRTEDAGRWCGIPVCTTETTYRHRCMADIDPLDVFTQMEKTLRP